MTDSRTYNLYRHQTQVLRLLSPLHLSLSMAGAFVGSVESGSVVLEALVVIVDLADENETAAPPRVLAFRLQCGCPGESILLAAYLCS